MCRHLLAAFARVAQRQKLRRMVQMTIFRVIKFWIRKSDRALANMESIRRAAILDLLDKEQCL